ncbi:hypothetical protein MKW98_012566 [Papaver atlanticum]|uniref:Uncharacterized protein n=1 Tax=Papaver atlanticum TaxID=357466 RepID=A0AAD4SZR2_9MAGN|nr:hypothetical protein MKW98_012566 [Papaver atlanticum]
MEMKVQTHTFDYSIVDDDEEEQEGLDQDIHLRDLYETQGYWRIFYQWVASSCCLLVHSSFLEEFRLFVQSYFTAKLIKGTTSATRCKNGKKLCRKTSDCKNQSNNVTGHQKDSNLQKAS